MFKKENRLVPGVRFNNAYSITVSQFVLKSKENRLTVNRFGIVVSKKIDKRAVVRNKIKRFFRTALANLDSQMSIGHDILLIAKKEILKKTDRENLLALEDSLSKAGIVRMND